MKKATVTIFMAGIAISLSALTGCATIGRKIGSIRCVSCLAAPAPNMHSQYESIDTTKLSDDEKKFLEQCRQKRLTLKHYSPVLSSMEQKIYRRLLNFRRPSDRDWIFFYRRHKQDIEEFSFSIDTLEEVLRFIASMPAVPP